MAELELAIPNLVFNFVIVTPFILFPCVYLWTLTASTRFVLWVEAIKMMCSFIAEECIFYAVHRALHESPFLYRNVHSLHHTVKNPGTFAAVYATPAEYAFGSIMPLGLVGFL